MVKKMISLLPALVVLTVLLTACSKKAEYTHVIPADASAVASFNLKSLINKAGLDRKESEADKQKVLDALKNELNAATFLQLEKIMKNPGKSGIDVQSPLYVFIAPSFPVPIVVAKIDDESNLRETLDIMSKEQISQPIAQEDGYSFTTLSGNLLAFNNSAAIMVPIQGTTQTEEAKKTIANLLKQTADNSIASSGAFRKMTKQKEDILFFASMEAVPAAYRRDVSFGLPADINPKDISIIGGLNFEKGKIVLKTENYTESDAMKALLKKQKEAFTQTNGTFAKYFPSSTLMFLNIGVKGEELYNLLNENQKFRNTASIAEAAEIKELFQSFKGDVTAGLINVTMENAPTFMAYAEVTNSNAVHAIYKNKQKLGLKKGEDIIELGKDEYVYKSKWMNIFFGVKGKEMYATNDELIYKSIGKAAAKSIKDSPYASDMKAKTTFMAINTGAILDLPVIKMLIGFGGKEFKTYSNLLSKVSYLSGSSEGDSNMIEFNLKDEKINALQQMVDFAKQFAGM